MNRKVKKGLEELVDLTSGKMTLVQLSDEIRNLYLHRNPEYCVITIERDDRIKGMRGTIYITKTDFKKYK